ncbi:MAG: MFS transporter, partial [Armatimonadota bacterium]
MKKWLILFASAMILLCLGGVYAWSAFIDSLIDKYKLSVTQTQIIFGTAICVFTVVMIWSGRLQVKYGPRPIALIGGILLSGGYLVCSLSLGSFAVLLMGYGLLGGAGIGFGYVCPIAACVKWFPSSRGSVTGIVVASFGAGAVVLSNLAESLLGKGLDVLHV